MYVYFDFVIDTHYNVKWSKKKTMLQFRRAYFDIVIYTTDCYYMTLFTDPHHIPAVQQTQQFSLKLWL
jgi:hypothetical protein